MHVPDNRDETTPGRVESRGDQSWAAVGVVGNIRQAQLNSEDLSSDSRDGMGVQIMTQTVKTVIAYV